MYTPIEEYEDIKEYDVVKKKVIDICKYSNSNVEAYDSKEYLSVEYNNFKEAYEQLPELTKDDLRKNFSSLLSKDFKGESFTVTTTGSTGTPTKTQWGYDEYNLSTIEVWKLRRKYGIKSGYSIIYFLNNDNDDSIIKKDEKNIYYLRREFTLDNVKKYSELINSLSNVLIYGSSSTLNNYANAIKNFELDAPKVNCIDLNGEMVYDNELENIKSVFKTNVYNNYGGREVWPIALTCEHGTMHVCNNLVYVTANQDEELLVTSLTKKCQPLIKYKIGDLGRVCWGKCSCGKTSQIITELIGRKNDYVFFKDGTQRHWSIISKAITQYIIENDNKICEYSITQKLDYSIVINVVKDKEYNADTEKSLIEVCRNICPSLDYSVVITDKITQNHRGKRIYFTNELKQN